MRRLAAEDKVRNRMVDRAIRVHRVNRKYQAEGEVPRLRAYSRCSLKTTRAQEDKARSSIDAIRVRRFVAGR